jgi:glycosyltransferase involved in cell wall biosynthesis
MSATSVDVVLPVFNGGRFVRRAIESVLSQDGVDDLTLWCIDDHSGDGSREILDSLAAKDSRVRVSANPDQRGVAATRNIGIRSGRAEFIAFIDQDDAWLPGKLALQIEQLHARPQLGYVLGHQEFLLQDGAPVPAWFRPEWAERPQPGYLPSALLARRETFRVVGLLDEQFRAGGDDTDWFARARRIGIEDAMLPETVFVRGIHDSNLSSDRRTSDELLKLIRTHISADRSGT